MVTQPRATLADVARAPTWAAPLLITIATLLAFTLFFHARVQPDYGLILRQQMQQGVQQGRMGVVPPDQVVQAQAAATRGNMPLLAAVAAFVDPVIGLLATSLVFWVVLGVQRCRMSFRQVFAIVAWSFCAAELLNAIVISASLLVRDVESLRAVDPRTAASIAATNLSLVLPPNIPPPAKLAASSLSIFTLWSLGLLALGFAAPVGSSPLQFPRAAATVVQTWSIWVVVKVLAVGGLGLSLSTEGVLAQMTVFQNRSASDSLAVMPFAQGGGDRVAEYFSDGVAESIGVSLSRRPQLRVLPPSSTARYQAAAVDPRAAGRELDVRALLTGRLTQSGDRLSVAAELVETTRGSRLWSGSYQGPIRDVFEFEEAIAAEVADALRVELRGQTRQRPARRQTDNIEAYQRYLRGRHALNRGLEDAVRQAIRHFQDAISLDPAYALAYAGLAGALTDLSLGEYVDGQPKEVMPRAKAAALKALELDDRLAETHATLARVEAFYDWDLSNAERGFIRAIELNPTSRSAHHWYWYALLLAAMGRFEEAAESAQRAQKLEPLSPLPYTGLGNVYYYARQYDRATEQYKRGLELDPKFRPALAGLARAYAQVGRYDEAHTALGAAPPPAPWETGWATSGVAGYAAARAGRSAEAQAFLLHLDVHAKTRYVPAIHRATVHAGLGNRDRAFESLNRAYEERSPELVFLSVEPVFDSLRADPLFADLVRRVGLPRVR
jgi:TolB-like protein/Tfp pilus assembly protein PilF